MRNPTTAFGSQSNTKRCQSFRVKQILTPVVVALFLFPSLAVGQNHLNEEHLEDTWVVSTNNKGNELHVSVNGEIVHGDRLLIRILKNRCDVGNIVLTSLTYKKNPDIENIKNRIASAVFRENDIKVRILFVQKFSLGYFVTFDVSWVKIDDIKRCFSGETRVVLTLKDDKKFKPSEYILTMENSWSLNGLESALDRASDACLNFPK